MPHAIHTHSTTPRVPPPIAECGYLGASGSKIPYDLPWLPAHVFWRHFCAVLQASVESQQRLPSLVEQQPLASSADTMGWNRVAHVGLVVVRTDPSLGPTKGPLSHGLASRLVVFGKGFARSRGLCPCSPQHVVSFGYFHCGDPQLTSTNPSMF